MCVQLNRYDVRTAFWIYLKTLLQSYESSRISGSSGKISQESHGLAFNWMIILLIILQTGSVMRWTSVTHHVLHLHARIWNCHLLPIPGDSSLSLLPSLHIIHLSLSSSATHFISFIFPLPVPLFFASFTSPSFLLPHSVIFSSSHSPIVSLLPSTSPVHVSLCVTHPLPVRHQRCIVVSYFTEQVHVPLRRTWNL